MLRPTLRWAALATAIAACVPPGAAGPSEAEASPAYGGTVSFDGPALGHKVVFAENGHGRCRRAEDGSTELAFAVGERAVTSLRSRGAPILSRVVRQWASVRIVAGNPREASGAVGLDVSLPWSHVAFPAGACTGGRVAGHGYAAVRVHCVDDERGDAFSLDVAYWDC
jgi:hypothetical protein